MISKIIHGPSVNDASPTAMRCLTADELDSVSGGGSGPPPWQAPEPCCGGKKCPC